MFSAVLASVIVTNLNYSLKPYVSLERLPSPHRTPDKRARVSVGSRKRLRAAGGQASPTPANVPGKGGSEVPRGAGAGTYSGTSAEAPEMDERSERSKRREMRARMAAAAQGAKDGHGGVGDARETKGGSLARVEEIAPAEPGDDDLYEAPPPRPPNPVLYVGEPVSSSGSRDYFNGFVVNDMYGIPQLIRKGDTVMLQSSPGELPYICQCREMWREKSSGEPYIRGVWFYRVSDLPADSSVPQELQESEPPELVVENEILASNTDSNDNADASGEVAAKLVGDDRIIDDKVAGDGVDLDQDHHPGKQSGKDPFNGQVDESSDYDDFIAQLTVRNLLLSSETFINSAETILAKVSICYANNTEDDRAKKMAHTRQQQLQMQEYCRKMGSEFGEKYFPVLFQCNYHYRSRCYDPAKRIVKFSTGGSKGVSEAEKRVEMLSKQTISVAEARQMIETARYIQKPYRRRLKKTVKKSRKKKSKGQNSKLERKLSKEERKLLARKEKEMAMLSEVPEPEPLHGLVEGSHVSVNVDDFRPSRHCTANPSWWWPSDEPS